MGAIKREHLAAFPAVKLLVPPAEMQCQQRLGRLGNDRVGVTINAGDAGYIEERDDG